MVQTRAKRAVARSVGGLSLLPPQCCVQTLCTNGKPALEVCRRPSMGIATVWGMGLVVEEEGVCSEWGPSDEAAGPSRAPSPTPSSSYSSSRASCASSASSSWISAHMRFKMTKLSCDVVLRPVACATPMKLGRCVKKIWIKTEYNDLQILLNLYWGCTHTRPSGRGRFHT